jgi:hypothetical protein
MGLDRFLELARNDREDEWDSDELDEEEHDDPHDDNEDWDNRLGNADLEADAHANMEVDMTRIDARQRALLGRHQGMARRGFGHF